MFYPLVWRKRYDYQKFLQILIGEGRNNFIIEYNENREEDQLVFLSEEDFIKEF